MDSPAATDLDLVRGLRIGRTDAFETFYRQYRVPIYNLCARILGDREEARDVTQEVFIKAFAQLPQQDEDLKLRAWLYRVATNACFDVLRKRRRTNGGDGIAIEDVPAGRDGFQQAQDAALIEQSLGQMSQRYRTALVLKDLHGLGSEEIASVLEVSRPTADVLVHRARTSFKTVFAKLAGSEAPAPASLAMVLVPLSLPAALQAMPPLPVALTAAPHAPVPAAHAVPHAAIPAGAGPAGAGLLTKIGASLGAKAAITAAAAALVVGGGVVALRELDTHHAPPAAAAVRPSAGSTQDISTHRLRQRRVAALHQARPAGHGTAAGHHQHHADHHGSATSGRHADHHSSTGGDAHPAETHHSTATPTSSSHAGHSGGTETHHGGDGSGSHD